MATKDLGTLPLVVIMGPTASGKSSVAIEIAKECNGEIIAADSRTIYKYMDIGTAKPTQKEQAEVPHWGIDLIEPGEAYSAADFKQYVQAKIIEIRSRGHVPVLVGGTGLYIDAVVFDYQFGPKADVEYRAILEKMSLDELYLYCLKNNVSLPENRENKRYIIRAIEQQGYETTRQNTPVENTIIIGIETEREILRSRINNRIEQLFERGVVEEAKILGKKYGWESEAMKGNIYPILHQYINNEIDLNEAKVKSITLDWRLAKRQMTWMQRNDFIEWMPLKDVKKYALSCIAK
jgi:tRNA dimethylallyltransferase